MSVTALKAKNTVESLRDIVQDLVAPDLKALRVTVDSHRSENSLQFDGLRKEIDSFRNEIRSSMETLRVEMRIRDEKQTLAVQNLSDKLGILLDVRERLAVLEDRSSRS